MFFVKFSHGLNLPDEYCANITVVQEMCRQAQPESFQSGDPFYFYGGVYLWNDAVYESQKGFDGSFAPYFSGHLYMLSWNLLKAIADHPETIFASLYASHSEDLQVGRFVQAVEHDRATKAEFITRSDVQLDVDNPFG